MAVFTKRIDSDIRDLDHMFDGSSWTVGQSQAFNVGNPGAVTRNIGLRFTGINIPQGATINSAKITFLAPPTLFATHNCTNRIIGIAQDNTAEFVLSPEDSARTRAKTTNFVNWGSVTESPNTEFDTPAITAIIQEIINRAGWVSGNALAIYIFDNGSSSGDYLEMEEYNSGSTKSALLTIDYVEPGSPSPSPTPSASPSRSPSLSPSASQSATPSPSASVSPSPSPIDRFFGLRIIKPEAVLLGKNVFNTQEPFHYIFDSDYGTLKYFDKQTLNLELDANAGAIGTSGSINHNLGYYPFIEVFVSVYIGSPTGVYEYCPFAGAGATVLYDATYKITTSAITLYGQINGVSSSLWHFDFLVFIYKNNLNL